MKQHRQKKAKDEVECEKVDGQWRAVVEKQFPHIPFDQRRYVRAKRSEKKKNDNNNNESTFIASEPTDITATVTQPHPNDDSTSHTAYDASFETLPIIRGSKNSNNNNNNINKKKKEKKKPFKREPISTRSRNSTPTIGTPSTTTTTNKPELQHLLKNANVYMGYPTTTTTSTATATTTTPGNTTTTNSYKNRLRSSTRNNGESIGK